MQRRRGWMAPSRQPWRRATIETSMIGAMTDDLIQRIERFRFPRGAVVAERRNRGYTLCHAPSGAPVARFRPTGRNDSVEALYWSAWKQRWTPTGPFGRTILPIDEALHFIAHEDIFWAPR